jgi:thioredoxin 1
VEEEDYIPPTNIVEIANKDQLLDLIKQKKAVVIDFWALWCGPCKKLKPHFEKRAAENENEDLVFASVNVDVAPDAAREFKVTKIP